MLTKPLEKPHEGDAVQMKENILISLKDIVVEFDGQRILKGINLDIHDEEFVTFLGPSGCGKTTTLRIIGGFVEPSAGDIFFDGKKINGMPPYKRNVNTVFQRYALFPHLNVFDNVAFGLNIKKMDKKLIAQKVKEMLKLVGLVGFENRNINQLSGGQQQRVAIARALATNPKIILCDEATSALDPTTTTSILNLLREINRKMGITIVIITHEMSVVESTCTHVAIIDDGQLAECGTVESVFSQPKSAAAKKLIFRTAGADSGAMGERMIRIVFEGSSADEPTISDLAMQCHVAVNIRYADTREVSGKLFGQMILQLPEDHLQQEKAIYFLQNKGLRVEEVNGYVHG